MLKELESYAFDKYIKKIIKEEEGQKSIPKEEIEKLNLTPQEENFIISIIKKEKIQITEKKITKEDRSPYVRDNNYGDIQAYNLQKLDAPVMSEIEYSPSNDIKFENYEELDRYLETRFIPSYVLFKENPKNKGEFEKYPIIRLHHITALKLSEAEYAHVMGYLEQNNIRVRGRGSTLDGEFNNYDYVTTYKERALPLRVPNDVTLQKIKEYKETKDKEIRDEIITDNMRLVPYVAYVYAISSGINQHELESYGYEGLIKAIEKFDLSKGYQFSTFAVSYIRGHVLQGITEILFGKIDNQYYDYVAAKKEVEKEQGLTLAEDPELIEDIIAKLKKAGKSSDSLETTRRKITAISGNNVSLDDEDSIEELNDNDYLIDPTDYLQVAMNENDKKVFKEVFATLTPREKRVLSFRFGLDDGRPRSLEEASKFFNVTRERIRQIEAKGLIKLRRSSKSIKLKGLLSDTERYGKKY